MSAPNTQPQHDAYAPGGPVDLPDGRVDLEELQGFIAAVLRAAGYRAEDAEVVADSLADADARGISSHGSLRTRVYVDRVRHGLVDVAATPTVTVDGPRVTVDAHNGPGHVAAAAATRSAIDAARRHGLAMAGVRSSNHCGTLAFYLRQIAEAGLVGIAASNGPPVMAYHGGRSRAVGTNPFGFAAPRASGTPIVLDMATSATARGKIIHAARTGGTIPEGWAVDTEGAPTRDPAAALAGAVVPFAGPKGSGVAMMVELLCGALLGGATGHGIGDMYEQWDRPQGVGHMFIAVDPRGWGPDSGFAERVAAFGDWVHDLPAASGHDGVLLPGEVEERAIERARRDGVTVSGALLEDLRALAEELGVARALHSRPVGERSER